LIAVDTNLIVGLYIPGDKSEAAENVFSKDPDWTAPLLWRSEFRNVLATGVRRKIFSVKEACLVIEEAERLMREDEYEVLSVHILELAAQSGCSAYDCEFVALARQLGVSSVTWDREILTAFPDSAVSPERFARA
jgi:predicted nucleic acid-binding protein